MRRARRPPSETPLQPDRHNLRSLGIFPAMVFKPASDTVVWDRFKSARPEKEEGRGFAKR